MPSLTCARVARSARIAAFAAVTGLGGQQLAVDRDVVGVRAGEASEVACTVALTWYRFRISLPLLPCSAASTAAAVST